MTSYVAFLRGINVGGKKLIKMDALARAFQSLGFENVKTFIQSGNVIFDDAETDLEILTKKLETTIHNSFGFEVRVMLQTVAALQGILKRNPFKKVESDSDLVFFVTFLSANPAAKPKLPLVFPAENVEIIAIKDRAAFILCRRKKNGMFAFPNAFVEKLGVSATTRNWTTVNKIVALVNDQEQRAKS
jgi:uncharacterized protein (DUF1697 family)